jgi:hypothetical protein
MQAALRERARRSTACPPAVRVKGVVKRLGSTTALAAVDLEVPKGMWTLAGHSCILEPCVGSACMGGRRNR